MFNQSLLGKWLWCYVHEREAWWRVVVTCKFGTLWGEWCSNEPLGMYGLGLRKNFCSQTKFEVEDSFKISFWHNLLCGNMSLKEALALLERLMSGR